MRRPALIVLAMSLVLVVAWLSGLFDGLRDESRLAPIINPLAPEASPPPVHSKAALESTLHVPIEIPVSEIADLVNKVIPDSLFRVRDMKIRGGLLGVKLDLDLVRDGEIETSTDLGLILNSMPLIARGRVRIPPGVWRPFESTFVVNAITSLTVDEEWRTQSSTRTNMVWGDAPFITVAGIKISLKGASEDALNDQLAQFTPEIDEIIEREVNLRKEVAKVWDDLAEPIGISAEPPMWLSIVPKKTYYVPPVSQGDTVLVELWVGATVETIVGEQPAPRTVGDLPTLLQLPDSLDIDYGFTIHLPVSVTYADAEAIVAKTLESRNLEIERRVGLELQNITLYGRGQSLVARVDFDTDTSDTSVGTNGRLFFTGSPAYDPEDQVIRVDSFDYDLESRNALAEVAAWVLREGFLEETQERLRFSIADEILLAKEELAEALKYRPIGKHIVLSGTLGDLTPGEIYLVDDGITVDIFAIGQLDVRIRELDQAVKKVPTLVN